MAELCPHVLVCLLVGGGWGRGSSSLLFVFSDNGGVKFVPI